MENLIFQEAFQKLNMLNEEDFNISNNDVDELKDFVDSDEKLDQIDIIDPEAESEEELEDSYIGKVVLDCCVCHSKIYKDADEVSIDEEGDLANMGEECPYCYSSDGYKVIGQITEFLETEVDVDVEPKEDAEAESDDITDTIEVEDEETEEEVEESLKEQVESSESIEEKHACKKCGKEVCECDKSCKQEKVDEALEKIDIETEHDNIHVETKEKVEPGEEMIEPVAPEVKSEIMGVEEEPIEDEITDEIPEDAIEGIDSDTDIDYEMEDFDEDTFNDLGESYLKKVYENVESFRTTAAKINENVLTLEGLIKFTSGKEKQTQFIFEAKDATKNGKVRFIGENAQISRGKKSFTLAGKFDGSTFISESLNYNYKQKTTEGKSTRVYGTVKLNG